VLSIGKVRGGESANVIPEHAELWGTLRTLERHVRERTMAQIHSLAKGLEQITGTRIDVRFERSTPSVYNDAQLTALISEVVDELLGAAQLEVLPRPSMGSEDFAVYLDHVPGVMFRLGCAGHTAPASGLHTPNFDVDERCLAIGAKILVRATVGCALREFDAVSHP
jgi:amidohydrolase